jgi:hypothetical protein
MQNAEAKIEQQQHVTDYDTGQGVREAVRMLQEQKQQYDEMVAHVKHLAETIDRRENEKKSISKKVLAYWLGLLKSE